MPNLALFKAVHALKNQFGAYHHLSKNNPREATIWKKWLF
jgi:hypothetical protein